MKKRILAFILSLVLIAVMLPVGIMSTATEATANEVQKFTASAVVEGSVSESDPRLANGYYRYTADKDFTVGGQSMTQYFVDPANTWKTVNLTDYIFTADQKSQGSGSDGVVSFFINASAPCNIGLFFYRWTSTVSNETSKVYFSVASGEEKQWKQIILPLNDFNLTSGEAIFEKVVVYSYDPGIHMGHTFDFTPITVYDSADIAKYSAPTGMTLESSKITLNKGTSGIIKPIFTAGENIALSEAVSYESSDSKVAYVYEDGSINALNEGTAVITATSESGLQAQCTVTVTQSSAASTVKFKYLPNSSLVEGVDANDPRFVDGYNTKVYSANSSSNFGLYTNGKSGNDWVKQNLASCVFTQAEKDAGSYTDYTMAFYVRSTVACDLKLRFYGWLSSTSVRETDYVTVSIPKEDIGEWSLIRVPMQSFTSISAEKDYARIIFEPSSSFGEGDVLQVTAAYIYDGSNIVEYGDTKALAIGSDEISLKKNEITSLEAIPVANAGQTALSEEITYTSNNELVATVSEDGTVFAHTEGTAVITASTASGITAGCTVNVSGLVQSEHIATFRNKALLDTDELFENTYILSAESSSRAFFANGENDWSHVDLSAYIDKTSIESAAVAVFYLKASVTDEFTVRFFKTLSGAGQYSSTNTVAISADKADEWQFVVIPLSEFTFAASPASFARFDFVLPSTFTGTIEVTPIEIYTANPYYAVSSDSENYEVDLSYYKAGETVSVKVLGGVAQVGTEAVTHNANGNIEKMLLSGSDNNALTFTMPESPAIISAEFMDSYVQNFDTDLIGAELVLDKGFVINGRIYLPYSDDNGYSETVIYNSKEYTVDDIGVLIVPEDVPINGELNENCLAAKKISIIGNNNSDEYIRASTANEIFVDYNVVINNVKENRDYRCRSYIKLVGSDETIYILGTEITK